MSLKQAVSLIQRALVTEVAISANQAVKDAYSRLKGLLSPLFADKPRAPTILDLYGIDSKAYKEPLKEVLMEVHIDQNTQVLDAAQEVVTLVQTPGIITDSDYANTNAKGYVTLLGPETHRLFTNPPAEPWDTPISGEETIENLLRKLLHGSKLKQPTTITVTGDLFPCALLKSGWWEEGHSKATNLEQVQWRDKVQEWLFHGFNLWGPSWDFTWNFDHWDKSSKHPYFIAQLGYGDEANSLRVIIPKSLAKQLRDDLYKWRGSKAKVRGLLGHRTHFDKYLDPSLRIRKSSNESLDYCLWISEDNKDHWIQLTKDEVGIYSGYLWKCMIPPSLDAKTLRLKDVYFVWDHTNLANADAVAYSREALERKEKYIKEHVLKLDYEDLVLVQKSSPLVPGEPDPRWKAEDFYSVFIT